MTSLLNLATIAAPRTNADEEVVALLRAHIPLTLLMDLAACDPHSRELYEQEPASNRL